MREVLVCLKLFYPITLYVLLLSMIGGHFGHIFARYMVRGKGVIMNFSSGEGSGIEGGR